MAQEEIKIVVVQAGAEQTTQILDNLTEALQNTGNAAEDAGEKSKKSGDSFTEFADTINESMDAFRNVTDTLKAAFEEFNKQSGVMRNFHGTISETSERMAGLVSNIQLMESANRVAATGLQLTDHEFGNLTVAAQRYAQATGQDLTQSMEQLSEAISEGSAEQLQRFGLELGNASNKAEVQEAALASLERQYGDLSAAGNGVTDVFTRMQVASQNATTDFIAGVNSVNGLNDAFDDLNETTDKLANALGIELTEGFSAAKLAGEIFSQGLGVILRSFSHFTDALIEFGGADYSEASESLRRAFDFEGLVQEQAIADIVGDAQAAIAQNQNIVTNAINQSTTAQQNNATAAHGTAAAIQTQGQYVEDLINRINTATQSQDVFNQIIQDGLNAEEELRQINFEKEQERTAAAFEIARQQNEERMQAESEHLNLVQQQQDDAESALFNKKMSNIQTYGAEFANIMGMTINAAIQGEMKLGKAMRSAIDEWLKRFAIQEALKGAAELAEGIGNTISNPPAAATHYASAAKHFAIAAIAGGASAAIPNVKSGPSASGGGAGGGTVTPTKTPTNDNKSQTGGTVVINVNGMTGATEAQIGRAYDNAIQSYKARY